MQDNILHPYRISNALDLNSAVRERVATLAGNMGIGDKLKHRAQNLSQGEKQRAAICRALLPHPKLIPADEATGNLDPHNKVRILDQLFQSYSKKSEFAEFPAVLWKIRFQIHIQVALHLVDSNLSHDTRPKFLSALVSILSIF